MRDAYVKNLRKLTGEEKGQINAVYKAALDASQQSYYESLTSAQQSGSEVRKFDVFEGTVLKYDPVKGYGYFIPNQHLKALLENSEAKSTSNFLSKKMNRFATILQEAYKDYHGEEKSTSKQETSAEEEGEETGDNGTSVD